MAVFRQIYFKIACFIGLFGLLANATVPAYELELKKIERPTYDLLYTVVPVNGPYSLVPVYSEKLQTLPKLVESIKDTAVVGINAGFFDPVNQETTSFVRYKGKVTLNPVDNRRFVENPDLFTYLPKMLNRSEFRIMDCGGKKSYDVTPHDAPLSLRCKMLHSIQAGPDLMNPKSLEGEAFVAYQGNQRIRDPLGVDNKNARSAVGIDQRGNVIIAMVSMKPVTDEKALAGVTLQEMANIMENLGAVKALSFDGGSSSTFWMNGETYWGKRDKTQSIVKRPIKSALVVVKETPCDACPHQ